MAGIAKPESFFDGLRKIGIVPWATWALDDHQNYTPERAARIAYIAVQQQSSVIITTEKDFVKLAELEYSGNAIFIAAALKLELQHEEYLNAALEGICLGL